MSPSPVKQIADQVAETGPDVDVDVDVNIPDPSPATGRATPTSRRGDVPPRRFRHRATIILAGASTLLLLALSCLDGAPDAAINLATGVGFSSPSRWWFHYPAIFTFITFAVALWAPPFQEPTKDWAFEKRAQKLRDLRDDDIILEFNETTGETVEREKTLAEVGLEGALAAAEQELRDARAEIVRLSAATGQSPATRLPTAPSITSPAPPDRNVFA